MFLIEQNVKFTVVGILPLMTAGVYVSNPEVEQYWIILFYVYGVSVLFDINIELNFFPEAFLFFFQQISKFWLFVFDSLQIACFNILNR